MQAELGELKREVASRKRGPGVKYPPELREQLSSTIKMLREAGWTYPAIGEAIGLSPSAVRSFFRKPRRKAAATRPRPVQVKAEQIEPRLVLVSPSGWRLEGLDVDGAASLLARLPC